MSIEYVEWDSSCDFRNGSIEHTCRDSSKVSFAIDSLESPRGELIHDCTEGHIAYTAAFGLNHQVNCTWNEVTQYLRRQEVVHEIVSKLWHLNH